MPLRLAATFRDALRGLVVLLELKKDLAHVSMRPAIANMAESTRGRSHVPKKSGAYSAAPFCGANGFVLSIPCSEVKFREPSLHKLNKGSEDEAHSGRTASKFSTESWFLKNVGLIPDDADLKHHALAIHFQRTQNTRRHLEKPPIEELIFSPENWRL